MGRARRARQGEGRHRVVDVVRQVRAHQSRRVEGVGRAAGQLQEAVLVVGAGHRQVLRGRHAVVRVDRHLLALGVRRTGRRELHAHATEAVGQVLRRDRRVAVRHAHGVGLRQRGRAG